MFFCQAQFPCLILSFLFYSSYEQTNIILSDVQEAEEVVEVEELASPIMSTEDVFQPRPCGMDDEDFYFPPGTKKG